MESIEVDGLKLAWVLADSAAQDPSIDPERIKAVASTWGSWKTWRSCKTDNVVCHDKAQAKNLLQRNFQQQCNFYVPELAYQDLDRPTGVKLYKGDFKHNVTNQEEIVTLHLAASQNDILLLLGFDLQERDLTDKFQKHQWHNYKQLIRQLIVDDSTKQWILVNHSGQLAEEFANLPNLQHDTLDNIA
jgi:hypothetical protein